MLVKEKDLEVKNSTIPGAGKGLFTKVAIAMGTQIIEYKGRITTWDKVKDQWWNPYLYIVSEDYVIDARRQTRSLGRYINDALGLTRTKGIGNNARFENDGKHVFVVASKNIQAGSEILVGYGKAYWDTVKRNLKIDAKEAAEQAQLDAM